ncbi:MAG: cupin 2 conserved barrel domain protein [Parcubacteria group bacterium Athens0714_24]|nr:MAG: cupin 2 conserved barrel domain protein [Parcubacteria group bacterium Athens0714_24]
MKIIKTKINFKDDRGIIRDIMSHTFVDAMTYITFTENAIRGNHYHKKTMQYDYIISGKLICRTREDENKEIEEVVVEAGDLIIHQYPFWHAYKALEDSVMISSTNGPRQGDQYEDDTFRLTDEQKLF